MLINVLDATGISQSLIVAGQEAVVDKSGSIVATGVAQIALDANANRTGFIIQNISNHTIYLNDKGAATNTTGSFQLAQGQVFPPFGYPVTTGAISVMGTMGDTFTAREW